MPTTDMKVVKGLNIAIIVMAALATLGSLAFIALFASGNALLSDPRFYNDIAYELGDELGYMYGYGHGYGAMTSGDAVSAIVGLTMGLIIAVFAWCLICSILTVISGVLGLRNATKPTQLKGAFVWAIVGAAAALLSGRIITMALLIISTFFIHRVRKSATAPYAPAGYGYAPQAAPGYQQPVYGQPAYSQSAYDQPAQPYAPTGYDSSYPQPQAQQPAYPQPAYAQPVGGMIPETQPAAAAPAAVAVEPTVAATVAPAEPPVATEPAPAYVIDPAPAATTEAPAAQSEPAEGAAEPNAQSPDQTKAL